MTNQSSVYRPPLAEPSDRQGIAYGVSLVAAALLFVVGVVAILQGIVAIAGDELYVAGVDYIYAFDTTTWGWIHLVLGIVAVICALGLVTGRTWGRYVAIGIAALVIIANFLSLPYYPLWAVTVIALSAVVIWAVATWQPQP
ncbi:DUF7144 family membrane protein [Nocardia takedensis]